MVDYSERTDVRTTVMREGYNVGFQCYSGFNTGTDIAEIRQENKRERAVNPVTLKDAAIHEGCCWTKCAIIDFFRMC